MNKSGCFNLIFSFSLLICFAWAITENSDPIRNYAPGRLQRWKRNIQDTDILFLRSLEEVKQQWEYFYELQKKQQVRTDQMIANLRQEFEVLKTSLEEGLAGSNYPKQNGEPCEDDTWVFFKHGKCLKFLNSSLTFENARNVCTTESHNGTSLLAIQSTEERAFVNNLLFKNSETTNEIWLDVLNIPDSDEDFPWNDSQLNFTALSNEGKCLRMKAMEEGNGVWTIVQCDQTYQVICQKQAVTLSPIPVQNVHQRIQALERKVTDSEDRLSAHIETSAVPPGFIYVQFPNQAAPTTLWLNVAWTDVTSEYAGKFFRAEGGNSLPFGIDQGQDSPTLSTVKYEESIGESRYLDTVDVRVGQSSDWIKVGSRNGSNTSNDSLWQGLQFKIDYAEVRPYNTAIKIWMRV